MFADEIRSFLRAERFRPFVVHLTDGSAVQIPHPDYAWVLPSGGELHVEDERGKVHLINSAQISKLTYDAPAPA